MKKRYISRILIFALLIIIQTNTDAQFYNGHQMSFGKNRVQYKKNSHWKFHRYDKFDVYFYGKDDYLAKKIAEIAEEKIPEVENFFGFSLQKRLIFVSYRTLADFRAGNIGYEPGDESTNTGGVTRIMNNKVLIYFEGENAKLENIISGGISEVIVNEMLYGVSYRQKLSSSALINLPEWFTEGLKSYLTDDWNYEIENEIRDAFKYGKINKINHLSGEDARIAGHSFWYFVSVRYGKSVIPNIIYLTRANKNSDTGFKIVTGRSVKDLAPEWKAFYEKMLNFSQEDTQTTISPSNEIVKERKYTKINNLKVSPDGRYLAYVSNEKGRFRVKLYDKEKQRIKTIFLHGHRLEQITDYSYPTLAWHPSGKMLAFITEEQGRPVLHMYYPESKETKTRNLTYLQKVLSFDYSDDGFNIVMSGVRNGRSDIYIFNTASSVYKPVTNDAADDLLPVFTNHSKQVIFSSDRLSNKRFADDDDYGDCYDLFSYTVGSDSEDLLRVSSTKYTNELNVKTIARNKFISLSDTNGIINQNIIKFDSTIAFIDTATHYRFFSTQKRITDLESNIYEFDYDKNTHKSYDIFLQKNRYRIFSLPVSEQANFNDKKNITDYKRRYIEAQKLKARKHQLYLQKEQNKQKRLDSLRSNPPKNIPHPDSILIDINNYVFEKEKQNSIYYEINPIKEDSLKVEKDTLIATRNYQRNFYTNYATQQVDFGYLSNSYQAFTGNAFYFNPGLNIFTKVGIYDLFEDYRLSGGFKIGTDLSSYEYLVSFENLKRRWDKEFIYHRQTYKKLTDEENIYSPEYKMYTNEFTAIMKYPFSQVASVHLTATLRHDKVTILPYDQYTLSYPDQYQFFSGVKAEFIFDNTLSLGLNLYEGTRFKIFSEFYQEVDQGYTNLWVNGFDFRFYKKIHRNFIFASRLAGSAVFGKSKLLYYLGGVDNWYSLSIDKEMFDRSVNINQDENYVYQAVATNMRGFIQNARNGTNFTVLNNELRLPLVRYLANRPLNSDFLNSFQVIGFLDFGSAWSGLTPFDDDNAYQTETVARNSVTVIVNKNRSAILAGYGFGLRSKLFGYFFRLDWAWGVDDYYVMPHVFYFSLNLDF